MGDRCHVEMLCHKVDVKRFEELGFVKAAWANPSDHLARMFDEQANYGAESDLQALADTGVAFIGASGAGDEYHAAVFACDGKRLVSVNSLSDGIESQPVTAIDPDGNADPGTMKSIKSYYRTLKNAKKKQGIA